MEKRKIHEVYDLDAMPYLYKEDDDEPVKERKAAEPKRAAAKEKGEQHMPGQQPDPLPIRKSAPLPLVSEPAPEAMMKITQAAVNVGHAKRRGWRVGIAVILLIALIAAFQWRGGEQPASPTALAVVNGEGITQQEINALYAQAQAQFPSVTMEQVLQQRIEEIVLLQEAKRKGITADPAIVEERLQQWIAQIQAAFSEEQIAEQLQRQGTTFARLQEQNREIIAKQAAINELLNKEVLATRSALVPGRVRAAHILLANESEALLVLQEVRAGADFGELAAQKSIDPSAAINQGDLGYFGRGQMVQEFEDAAFAADPGEIVGPVQTSFGFHVIKVEESLPEERKIIGNLSPEEQQLVISDIQDALQEYVARLRNLADIRITGAQAPDALDTRLVASKETFIDTGQQACLQDGKPVIRMFSAADCAQCQWVAAAFDSAMQKYADAVVAHRWELDTGDDQLTGQRETEIPAGELTIFEQVNPDRSVPTFVFGCRYVRIGNGYGEEQDLGKEGEEFREIVRRLASD